MPTHQIFKYQVEVAPFTSKKFEFPADAEFLHFDLQGGIPTVWLKVDPLSPTEGTEIHCLPTGALVSEKLRHFGTYQDGSCVWHLFGESKA